MVFHSNNEAESSPSKGKVRFHWLIDGDTKGWIHTHGMDVLGLPELELRGCPAFLAESAVHLMRSVCDYMLASGKVVKAGENMATSDRTMFSFAIPEPVPGSEDHYEVERLQITDVDQQPCDECMDLRSEMLTNLLDDPDEACLD